ncbi:putative structural maintenance of chromosome (SMC) family protein [Trypanosoma rangeli]|uniref:Structural maintenance of chromosomes protein n=1 Tax=Trypanosoma rangeli TaxID=5698 RepID=A0A422NR06_TRYRA|nr:putative structural maintenance of chromosome (SMC) family protein [Trypanosoma rangeli]RNF07927.1 putative structural maintenance of chromosome (SMC) family protein [Trypanosoma rangeli]|eukprot:RNF07927.1 putative structural maintenance of chromosome (SMC) family protein [Trypanosoma rangeli]
MLSRIDRVELYNFKSYAGNVTIGPLKDFTCIVGPNGAGKSNFMDALGFVLSPSAATTLRGKGTADLIYRGAQPKECAVTAVLCCTTPASSSAAATGQGQDTEVSFTRAVDQRGKIAHKINGAPVEERKYFAALAKFKVGARVNNFLVFQHEVEAIAQKKARELTDLLEQVSGSGELKEEYDRCKKAHEVANQELTAASAAKRDAVVALNQMRLQKKEAEKYEEVLRRISEERRNEALVQLFYVESSLERQKWELQAFNEKLTTLEKSIASDEDIRRMKREYAGKHKVYLEELKRGRREADALREKHNTLEHIKASLNHLRRKQEVKQQELEGVMKTQRVQSHEVQRLEEQLQKQRGILQAFDERCRKEDAEHTTLSGSLSAEQLSEYRQLRKEAECETVVLRQQLERIKRQQQSLAEGQKQCTIATENVKSQRQDLQQGVQRGNDRVAELQRRMRDLQDTVEELTHNIGQKRADLLQTEKRTKEREVELAMIQEQLHELRFIKENDKHGSRMTGALQALRALYGIRGRLVDLCTIPNDKYRHAVTVALGRNLEAVVVDTTETAISCVRYLKEQRLPPMTFLPLDSVQGREANDRLRTFGGTCKPVVDVIRYDTVIEPAVQYALGQTLVCDGMMEARRVAYGSEDGERFKVVTLDGSVLMRNGAVQGGLASIQSRARKWDEKKYEDLRAARDRLLSELAGGSEVNMARAQCELRDTEARLEFVHGRIKAVGAELQATEQKVSNMNREMEKQKSEQHTIERRYTTYESELRRCLHELQETRGSILHVEQRIFSEFIKRVKIPNLLELESHEAQRVRERAEERQQIQLLLHKLEISLEAERKRIGVQSIDELRGVCERIENEIRRCEKDLATYSEIVRTTEKKQSEARVGLSEAKVQLDALEANIRQQSRTSEQELGKLAQARRGVTALQAACDTLRLQRMSIMRRCQMEGITLPLKPVEVVGAKRSRLVNSDELSQSEPFTLLEEASVTAPTKQLQSSHSRPPAATGETQVMVDFSGLTETLRKAASDKTHLAGYKQRTEALLENLQRAAESLVPSLKAASRFVGSEDKLTTSSAHLEEVRERASKAYSEFAKVKELRTQRFMETFERIAENVDRVYRELTLSTRAHAVHGSAYLSLEDVEEPYLAGTRYHATPPLKRYMPMELLSGGERTMAALALIFAVHAVSPTPFFVLDEVDAALDAGNVEKLANYMRKNCNTTQFLVISLKDQLYHVADMLVGVLKNKQKESSSVLTMDLRGYPF